ncbi:MAG: ABC transporter permease [Bryobacteraceae bacterium]
MNLARAGVVFRKELMDGLRDKRSIWSLVFSSLVGPLLIGYMFTAIAERQRAAEEIKVPVVGGEYAPAFVDWLRQQSGVEVTAPPAGVKDAATAEAAIRDRKEDVVIIIEKEFSEKFARSLPAPLKLVSDDTRDASRPKVRRVRNLIGAYSNGIGSLRLIARGVSPSVASAIRVDDVEVSSSQQRAARIMSFLPMFLMLASFVGCLQIAADSTAGERERGSLEPLLLNPVSRQAIVAGKWLAAACSGTAAVLFSAVLCTVIMQRIPLHDLGARFRFGPLEIAALLVLIVPAAFLGSALVMTVSMFARTYKEAQSYLGMLVLVPMLPGMFAAIVPMSGRPWLAPIPIVGQYALMNDVMGGKMPAPAFFVIAAVCTLAAALLLVAFTTRLIQRERIIFGR